MNSLVEVVVEIEMVLLLLLIIMVPVAPVVEEVFILAAVGQVHLVKEMAVRLVHLMEDTTGQKVVEEEDLQALILLEMEVLQDVAQQVQVHTIRYHLTQRKQRP